MLLLYFELLYPGAPIRFVSGFRDMTLDSQTYQGSGNILRVGEVAETADSAAQRLDVFIVGRPAASDPSADAIGIPAATLMQLQDAAIRGSEANLTLGMHDADTGALIASERLFAGYVDSTSLDLGLGLGEVRCITWEGLSRQSFGFNLTEEHHRLAFPDDPSLQYAHKDFIVLVDRD